MGLERFVRESKFIKHEFGQCIVSYIVAAFGLVAGLAWNEAIKGLIEWLFPLRGDSVVAKFIYAVLITVVVVVITSYLAYYKDHGKNTGHV